MLLHLTLYTKYVDVNGKHKVSKCVHILFTPDGNYVFIERHLLACDPTGAPLIEM